jgi:hypothetical protein
MEAALRVLLPRLLGEKSFQVYPYQCKDDLLAKLPARLRGYRSWLPSDWRIVVLVDRDDDDCAVLKQKMERMASQAGLVTKSATSGPAYSVVNRVVIEELEAWYFGDWQAVCAAYPKVLATIPNQVPYRNSDAIRGGTWEAFEKIMQKAGYFRGGLRKIEAARAVAEHWNIDTNTSRSFQVLRDVLRELATT